MKEEKIQKVPWYSMCDFFRRMPLSYMSVADREQRLFAVGWHLFASKYCMVKLSRECVSSKATHSTHLNVALGMYKCTKSCASLQ